MKYTVFVPYSPRSWNGITNDVRRHFGDDAEIIALVLEGEHPNTGCPQIEVFDDGGCHLEAVNKKNWKVVVVNGGPTALTVGAINLARRGGWAAVNLQPEKVTTMHTD